MTPPRASADEEYVSRRTVYNLLMNFHNGCGSADDADMEKCEVCSILKTVAEIVRDKEDI